jgi:hypothetical protein
MIPIKFGYLIGVLAGTVEWLWVLLARKDLRKIMLGFGIVLSIIGMFMAYFWWTTDWWHPATITGTKVGIEDFISGVGIVGITVAIYAVTFKKKIVGVASVSYKKLFFRGLLLVEFILATYIFIHFFRFPTFYSVYLSMLIGSIVIFINRRDLIIPGLATGVLIVILMAPIYWVIILTTPHWVEATYNFNHLSGILITGIPVEELMFFLFWGMFLGPFYEYWTGARFEPYKLKK